MAEQGAQVGTAVLTQRIVPAPVAIAGELDLEVAADVVELVRLRSVDGAPNHVAHSFLPAARFPRVAEACLDDGSLYDLLRQEYDADLARARIVVDVGTATPEEADLLRIVAGSPLLVVRTTVRDSGGSPLVHSFSRLRPDVSRVEFEVSVTSAAAVATPGPGSRQGPGQDPDGGDGGEETR